MQAEALHDPLALQVRRRVEHRGVDAVVGDVDLGRVGVEQPDQLVAGGPGRDDEAGGLVQRGPGGATVELGPLVVVELRVVEDRGVVDGHHDRDRGVRRHRVERAVDDVRAYLLGQAGQAFLLPGQPLRAVVDVAGGRQDGRGGGQPGQPVGVRALAGDAEVGTGSGQRGQQAVDVTAQATTVGRNCRGVDEDAGRHRYSLQVHRDGTRTPAYCRACSEAYAAPRRVAGCLDVNYPPNWLP